MTATAHDDHHADTFPDATIDTSSIKKAAFLAAVGGAAVYVALGVANFGFVHEHGLRDFFVAYLVGFVFWASLPFGSLALMNLGYLGSASWGVVLRRVFQANVRTLPLLGILFIPVAVSLFVSGGKESPYWWANTMWEGDPHNIAEQLHLRPEAVEENQHKIHDYLNPPFYIARTAIYLGIMFTVGFFVLKWSRLNEEHDDQDAYGKLRAMAGPAMILWAFAGTPIATDWIMSVEPTWASSMFPVVYGMNQFITTFALSVFVVYSLVGHKPEVMGVIKDKFRIDIGSLVFGFTMVWAYATFCQYMLIWAGNLPEEIAYYRKRADHGWQYMCYFLMAFHWLAPFVIFLFREVKTDPRRMKVMCLLLLTVCAADVCWWIVPAWPHPEGGLHLFMAFAAVVMIGGVWGLAFARELGKAPILPSNREGKFLANWGHHH